MTYDVEKVYRRAKTIMI